MVNAQQKHDALQHFIRLARQGRLSDAFDGCAAAADRIAWSLVADAAKLDHATMCGLAQFAALAHNDQATARSLLQMHAELVTKKPRPSKLR